MQIRFIFLFVYSVVFYLCSSLFFLLHFSVSQLVSGVADCNVSFSSVFGLWSWVLDVQSLAIWWWWWMWSISSKIIFSWIVIRVLVPKRFNWIVSLRKIRMATICHSALIAVRYIKQYIIILHTIVTNSMHTIDAHATKHL